MAACGVPSRIYDSTNPPVGTRGKLQPTRAALVCAIQSYRRRSAQSPMVNYRIHAAGHDGHSMSQERATTGRVGIVDRITCHAVHSLYQVRSVPAKLDDVT